MEVRCPKKHLGPAAAPPRPQWHRREQVVVPRGHADTARALQQHGQRASATWSAWCAAQWCVAQWCVAQWCVAQRCVAQWYVAQFVLLSGVEWYVQVKARVVSYLRGQPSMDVSPIMSAVVFSLAATVNSTDTAPSTPVRCSMNNTGMQLPQRRIESWRVESCSNAIRDRTWSHASSQCLVNGQRSTHRHRPPAQSPAGEALYVTGPPQVVQTPRAVVMQAAHRRMLANSHHGRSEVTDAPVA